MMPKRSQLLLLLIGWATLLLAVRAIRILPSERGGSSRRAETHQQHQLAPGSTQTPVHVKVPTSPDAHLVTGLPLLAPGSFTTKHWAGHLPASRNGDKYFFYWLFAPSNATTDADAGADNVPLVVWLNGGPACSSMDGLFLENGPFRLTVDPATGQYQITAAEFSWHRAPAYTLYIDQPVGTGLSFTTSAKYPTNDKEVNTDFYYFLQEFLKLHSDKFVTTNRLNRRLFFSGESYAGHYIPSLMNYILKQNDDALAAKGKIVIPVTGGAIGNGWTDPFYQYAGADFAYGHGLIGTAEVAAFKAMEQECQAELNRGHYSVGVCFDLIDDILAQSHGSASEYKASGYDVRKYEKKHGSRAFPPGHKVVETYLGGWTLPSDAAGELPTSVAELVLEAIHATAAADAGQIYQECTDPPYNALANNDGKGVVDDVVGILKHPDGVQLLFFNGIHDIVCNHVGNERYLEMLPWEHAEQWMQSERYAWVAASEVPGQVSGYMKEYQNLKFLKVLDAGHMVPMDRPSVALDMVKLFIYNGSFDTSKQELNRAKDDNELCEICPTCWERDSAVPAPPASNSTANSTAGGSSSSSGGHGLATFVISYAWLVAGVGFAAFCLIVSIVRRRGSVMSSVHHRAAIVPQFDLELRDSTTYRDDFEASNGDAEENGVVA